MRSFFERNRSKTILSLFAFLACAGTLLEGCTDIGERDNPLDAKGIYANGGENSDSDKNDDKGEDEKSSSSVASSSSAKSSSSAVSSSSVKSSSGVASSSSSIVSSSSQKISSPSEDTGTMTDARDNKTYKTVTIGTQTWMAENLNYAYMDVKFREGTSYESDSTSWCYNNSADSCAKYGRLYTWAAAMDSAAQFSTAGKGCGYGKTCSPSGTIRGVCPEGWHLPNDDEWNTLWTAVGGTSTAGTKLKSTSGWYSGGNGTDSNGFSVLPAGYRNGGGGYSDAGDGAYFWSSSEYSSDGAYCWYFYYSSGSVDHNYSYEDGGFSVRCLRDS